MNRIITDNLEIYQLLENSNSLFNDFTIDHVIELELNDSFFIVLYNSASRDFMAFEGEEFRQKKDVLPDLLQMLQEYRGVFSSEIIQDAIKIIENKIHSKNGSDFYFDAH